MKRKLETPFKWELKKIEPLKGTFCYQWTMAQTEEDYSKEYRNIYRREWFSRGEFESWLRDRYSIKFVREVLNLWPIS